MTMFDETPPSYKSHRDEKFNKTKEKARQLLSGIDQSSLREDDKKILIKEIKSIVANY